MTLTLRNRIIITFTALGVFISMVLGFIAYNALEYSEEIFVEQNISEQTELLSDLYIKYRGDISAQTERYKLFVQHGEDTSTIPASIQSLQPQDYEVIIDGVEYEHVYQ